MRLPRANRAQWVASYPGSFLYGRGNEPGNMATQMVGHSASIIQPKLSFLIKIAM